MRSVVLLLLFAGPAFAQGIPRTHAVTLDDYFTLAGVSQLSVSPDGKLVAYSDARWDRADDQRKSDLLPLSKRAFGFHQECSVIYICIFWT